MEHGAAGAAEKPPESVVHRATAAMAATPYGSFAQRDPSRSAARFLSLFRFSPQVRILVVPADEEDVLLNFVQHTSAPMVVVRSWSESAGSWLNETRSWSERGDPSFHRVLLSSAGGCPANTASCWPGRRRITSP